MCALTPPYYTPSSTYHIFIRFKRKGIFPQKSSHLLFFYNCAMNNKIWNAISKDKKRGHFSPYIIIIMNFLIFWFAILCLLIIKEFRLDVIFFLLFYCYVVLSVCFFAGDSWENVFRRSYWSGAVRRRLPIGSTVLAPWTAYLFSASFFSVCDVCFVVYSRSSYPEATE